MSEFPAEIQKLDPSAEISLFTLDCTSVGGVVIRFVQGMRNGAKVKFGGIEYQPIDIQFDGLEVSGVGALPTPKITLANTDGLIQSVVNTYGDLNGCVLMRIRTFARFLDGEPDADNLAYHGPDIYQVERKVTDTPTEIAWELSASIDQQGRMLPGRPMIRNVCMWRYRVWDGSKFDYARATCPYTGTKYWDEEDKPVTNPAKDKPSRTKNCCRLRFGKDQPWPFGGFPGMGRPQ